MLFNVYVVLCILKTAVKVTNNYGNMQYSWIFLTINYDYLQKSLQLAYKNKRTRGQEDKRTRGQEDEKKEPLRLVKRLL